MTIHIWPDKPPHVAQSKPFELSKEYSCEAYIDKLETHLGESVVNIYWHIRLRSSSFVGKLERKNKFIPCKQNEMRIMSIIIVQVANDGLSVRYIGNTLTFMSLTGN